MPLVVRGQTLGAITFVTAESGRRYGSADLAIAEELARRAALAINNARLYWAAQDEITERRRAEAALRQSEARLQGMIHSAMDAIITIDAAQRITLFNPAAEQMFRCTAAEVIGQPIDRFIPEQFRQVQAAYIDAFGHTGTTSRTMRSPGTLVALRANGEEFPIEATISQVEVASQKLYTVIIRDITERAQAEAALRRHAFYDPLTDLPNRALFLDRLQHVLERFKRHPEQRFAVLFLDLDRFKTINDSLGHLVGDQLLIEVARQLTQHAYARVIPSRGSVKSSSRIRNSSSQPRDATQVAERILHALALPFHLNGHTVVTTASIGIVLSTRDYARPDDLLRNADSAMYHAKAQGKGQYAVFDPSMHAQVLRFLHLEADLRQAIARQELRLHYQPIMALASGAIIGVEALARWQHPERGTISPAEFIPLAEETGLIIPLGEWVLRTACAQAKAWQAAGLPPCYMAVNVSAQQLRRPEAGARIMQIVHETGLEPQCLKLELTESSVWEHGEAITTLLQQLSTSGVHLSVDDFGTGYSSLSALKHLPIVSLKIDQAFVRDIPTDPNDAAIVMAMIAVAHSLELQVIAEGVETEAQAAFLRAQQCDAIQGYLVSRPMPADVLPQRLQQIRG